MCVLHFEGPNLRIFFKSEISEMSLCKRFPKLCFQTAVVRTSPSTYADGVPRSKVCAHKTQKHNIFIFLFRFKMAIIYFIFGIYIKNYRKFKMEEKN